MSRTSFMNSGVETSGSPRAFALRVERGAQESHGGDARHFHRVLEGEEHALGGALVRAHLQNAFAVEQHVAFGDGVVGLAGQHIGERRLAGAVRAHDGRDLALLDGQVETVEDLLALDLDVQIFDFKKRHLSFRFSPRLRNRRSRRLEGRGPLVSRLHPSSRALMRPPQNEGIHQPTDPSSLIEISFCASTANSIGSCCSTSLTKPLTTSAVASSADMPRLWQ